MPSIHDRVSEYVLELRIGAGAFGEVWRARHHVWQDRLVAIKFPNDPQYVRNLQAEGSVVQNLVHPNVVRAIGFDPYGNPPYLVMEYVQGMNLRGLIRQSKRLEPGDAIAILGQILQGLEYAHGQGLIHRDMKPENVLISQEAMDNHYQVAGSVKVTDFGFGRAVQSAANESIAFSASINSPAAQALVGTLDYMSPEQRAGQDVDVRTDLYACGVMLFEMLTGEKPAGSEKPSDLNPQVPALLDKAFMRSYCRLDKRYPTARDFLADLVTPAVNPPPMPGTGAGLGTPPPMPGKNRGERVCPQCRRFVSAMDQFCMYCGVQLVAEVRRCPQCGTYPDPMDTVCVTCGTQVP